MIQLYILATTWLAVGIIGHYLANKKAHSYPVGQLLAMMWLGVFILPHTLLSYKYESFGAAFYMGIGVGYSSDEVDLKDFGTLEIAEYTILVVRFKYVRTVIHDTY